MTGKARVLQLGPLPEAAVVLLRERFALVTEAGAGIGGIATNGKQAIDGPLLDRLPDLAIVSCLGAGTDGIDMQELARRGIAVATTASVLAADVADIAIGLVIAPARDFRRADRFVREGGMDKRAGTRSAIRSRGAARHPRARHDRFRGGTARRGLRHGDRLPQPRAARGRRRPLLPEPSRARGLVPLPRGLLPGRAGDAQPRGRGRSSARSAPAGGSSMWRAARSWTSRRSPRRSRTGA